MMLMAPDEHLIDVTLTDHVCAGFNLIAATACVIAAAAPQQFTPKCGREACAVRPCTKIFTMVLAECRTAAHMSPAFRS